VIVYFYYIKEHENFIPHDVLTEYKYLQQNIKLMKKFVEITDNHNLKYWAIGGTLLGAVRDKGIIPWDDDLDVSMMSEEVVKLFAISDELKNKYNLGITKWWGGYKLYDLDGSKIDNADYKYPFLDIFPMISDENGDFIYEFIEAQDKWPDIYYKNETFPLKKYEFEDFYIWGPKNAEQFLDDHYQN